MALIDVANAWLSDENDFVFRKFIGACLKSAAFITAEDGGTPNHANRLLWAAEILSADTEAVVARVREQVRYGAATNPTMQANPNALTDNDIEFIVASGINIFATG